MGNNLSREAEMSREIGESREGGITINIGISFVCFTRGREVSIDLENPLIWKTKLKIRR